jgi:hypothetical protein
VKLSLLCGKGKSRYINFTERGKRTGFKETFILMANELSELSK